MKRCPHCAEEVLDTATECPRCGRGLPADPGAGLPPPPPGAGEADDEPLQYTHSGARHLLGYGRTFFGIWDRASSSGPVSRFPRTDEGWRSAWLAFSALEPDSTEVGMRAPARPVSAPRPTGPPARRPGLVSRWWWALPILLGFLGGLVAWIVNKDVDPRLARSMLITGFVITVLAYVLGRATFMANPPT